MSQGGHQAQAGPESRVQKDADWRFVGNPSIPFYTRQVPLSFTRTSAWDLDLAYRDRGQPVAILGVNRPT